MERAVFFGSWFSSQLKKWSTHTIVGRSRYQPLSDLLFIEYLSDILQIRPAVCHLLHWCVLTIYSGELLWAISMRPETKWMACSVSRLQMDNFAKHEFLSHVNKISPPMIIISQFIASIDRIFGATIICEQFVSQHIIERFTQTFSRTYCIRCGCAFDLDFDTIYQTLSTTANQRIWWQQLKILCLRLFNVRPRIWLWKARCQLLEALRMVIKP